MIQLLLIFSVSIISALCSRDCYQTVKVSHHLSAIALRDIVKLANILDKQSSLNQIFNKINLIRPVGSSNHLMVRRFIREYLSTLNWNVEETAFSMETVIGPVNFVNVIGTQNVTKPRRLVLACHYESLTMKDFFGSMDSAMPCALMLSIAGILTPLLKMSDLDVSLELIFFDGEEAFIQWSDTDSLYGSRYLANLWSNNDNNSPCSRLNSIDSMVLLDLLGANNPKFYFFSNGNYRLFESLARIESSIEQQEDIFRDLNHPYFNTYTIDSIIQDDHVPFLNRGVSVVHLIPVPFPPQWHKVSDNAQGINWKASKDIELILTVFVAQYFHLGDLLRNLQNNEL